MAGTLNPRRGRVVRVSVGEGAFGGAFGGAFSGAFGGATSSVGWLKVGKVRKKRSSPRKKKGRRTGGSC